MELVLKEPVGGALYEQILGLPAARGTAALLRRGDLELELFEFLHPAPRLAIFNRSVCDHGITHFCIEVDYIEAEFRRLTAAGVTLHLSPARIF
jgi:catechol 2,3-dioxygenase-like lactoylglutathione lyase family enzyme